MNASDKRAIEKLMEDSIMGMPISFVVDGVHFFLYPVTLGRAYLIEREREAMAHNLFDGFKTSERDEESIDYKRSICRIVAMQTLKNKEEIFDSTCLNNRTEYFYQHADESGLFRLYDMILESFGDSKLFIETYGLDYDKKTMAKIAKLKNETGSVNFGGKTAYGGFIGQACEKFGWTVEYVVWGISLTNLEMLLADAPTSVYLTQEERKKLRISKDRTIIDAGDPANKEKIKSIIKGC